MNFGFVASLIVVILAVLSVFIEIPIVSNYAFWFAIGAYILLALGGASATLIHGLGAAFLIGLALLLRSQMSPKRRAERDERRRPPDQRP